MRPDDLQKQFDALVPRFEWGSEEMDMSIGFGWCKNGNCLEACQFIISQTKKMLALKDRDARKKVCQDTWDVITGKREPTEEEWPPKSSSVILSEGMEEVDDGTAKLKAESQ